MLIIRTPALFLMLGLASGQAHAADPAAPEDVVGVWQGTLGKQRIAACFDADPDGAYYYERHLLPIGLHRNKEGNWEEVKDTGTWSLHDAGEDALSGEWRKPKAAAGGLPINLHRVGTASEDCRSDRFNLPLEKGFQLETKPREAYGPMRGFRRLAYLGEASVELEGNGPAVTAINRDLRQALPLDAQRKREILGDQRSQMGGYFSGAWDETYAEPVLWSEDFVSIEFYRWARGMGANGISIEYRTYDLQSGKRVDPLTWFKGSPGEGELPAPLAKVEKPDAECSEDRQEGGFLLKLKKDTVWFWQMSACGRELEVPYKELAPYLTSEGKAAVTRLLEHPGFAKDPEKTGK